MLVIEADIHEYVGMSYVDKNILGPLVHMHGSKKLIGRLSTHTQARRGPHAG